MEKNYKFDTDNLEEAKAQAEEIFIDEELEDEYINSRSLIVEEDTFIYYYADFIASVLINKFDKNITEENIIEEIKINKRYLDQIDDVVFETTKVLDNKYNIVLNNELDLKNIAEHKSKYVDLTKEIYELNSKKEIALKSGYYFMIFNKSDVPFFNELDLVSYQVQKDNKVYDVYEANCWETAQKVDEFMGNDFVGYDIDEYKINNNIDI